MKKFILLLLLTLLSVSGYSQVSVGKLVMFPDAKIVGSVWKPQIGFVRMDERDILCIRTCNNDSYSNFDAESRVLIRFADSTMVKLPIIEELDVRKDFKTDWVASSLVEFYTTYSFYDIEEEIVNKIVVDNIPIIKIRLVFTNGNIKDYDIHKNYQKKLVDGLVFSKTDAMSQNEVKKSNQTDNDF